MNFFTNCKINIQLKKVFYTTLKHQIKANENVLPMNTFIHTFVHIRTFLQHVKINSSMYNDLK